MRNIDKNKQFGFTLMETMIAIGIFLIIVVLVWAFIIRSYSVQKFAFGQATAISEAQRGVETLVKEIREALPGDTGDYSIVSADDNEIVFYADYDRDDAVERVRYFLQGSDFIKGVIEASGYPLVYDPGDEVLATISKYVRNESYEEVFSYYDGDYSGKDTDTPMATPANVMDVKMIHIHLKINVYQEQAPTDFHLESDVQIRNLKDNL